MRIIKKPSELEKNNPTFSVQVCTQLRFCMFCCALLYVHSSFAIILTGKRELAALLSFVFLVSRDCCVALPRGAMGLSAVSDCVFFLILLTTFAYIVAKPMFKVRDFVYRCSNIPSSWCNWLVCDL